MKHMNNTFLSEVILTVHRRYYVEIKCQLDATDDTAAACKPDT